MKNKLDFVNEEISRIRKDNLYRKLQFGIVRGPHITVNDKKLLNLCSNDYLGLPVTKLNQTQMQSSSRLVSGNDESYKMLEKTLAKHKSKQDSLVFSTGYMANLGTISAVARKGDVVFSDELNHASIIEACKLSGAKVIIYRHNDTDDLETKIKKEKKRKFIITEGVFSMDGDFAKLDKITEIASKNNAITILDDAHGDFVVGKDGRGTANHFAVSKKIDIYISSLSKGLGSFGGYVTSQANVVDLCINRSKSFIYTSALPSIFVKHSLKRIETNRELYRKRLNKNTKKIAKELRNLGFSINSDSQIIPIIIGKESVAMDFGKYLMSQGVFAQPIRFPTVAKNQARIRLSMTAWFDDKQIQKAIDVFEKAGRKFNII